MNRSDVLIPAPHEDKKSSIELSKDLRAFPASARFIADHWIRILVISALILIPCVWHRHIEAGDLGIHVYNAWLAQLIEHGQAPGLRLAYPSTNILFDSLLSGLAKIFGLRAAEILSVAGLKRST